MNQKGQIILILVLVMTVALAIGLSVVQRSLSDISTSSKVEQSSRAFSAAEAGIEDKLSGGTGDVSFPEISSEAQVSGGDLYPAVPDVGSQQEPLEYPPLAKEEVAHVWLADYTSASNPPSVYYSQNSLNIYWGNSATDRAALELTLVYHDGSLYRTRKWYLDQAVRTPANNFDLNANCTTGFTVGSNQYQCRYIIGGTNNTVADTVLPSGMMLFRARLLYNTTSQPFAVQAVGTRGAVGGTCASGCWLPPQVKSLTATGTSGGTQRKVQVFRLDKVVPPYFDYAIFSMGAINK